VIEVWWRAGEGGLGWRCRCRCADDVRRSDGAVRPRRPDLRFGMEIVDITDLAKECEFKVFRGVADVAGACAALMPRAPRSLLAQGHRRTDRLRGRKLRREGAGVVQGRGRRPPGFADCQELRPRTAGQDRPTYDAAPGDFLLIAADKFEVTCKTLYALRKRLAAELKLYDPPR